MTLTRWLNVGIVLAGVVIVLLIVRGCRDDPTKIEQQVDSTLATVPAWQDSVRIRDSVIAARGKTALKLQREVERWQDSADVRLQRADSSAKVAASLSEIPSGITPHDTIVRLTRALDAQMRASVALRTEVIPALQQTVASGRVALAQANATIELQRRNLDDAYDRVDRLTVDLSALREETKHKGDWNVLGLHVPEEVKTGLLIVGSGYAGYRIGRAAS